MRADYWQTRFSALKSLSTARGRGVALLEKLMKTGCVRSKLLLLGALVWTGMAGAYESPRPVVSSVSSIFQVPLAAAASLYELADPLPLSSARWDSAYDSRLELSAGLLPRHEVRFSTTSRAGGWTGSDMSLAGTDAGWSVDPLRATYRYTFFERRDWAWKVGVTARLGEPDQARGAAIGVDRTRFGAMPLVHFAGAGKLAGNWLLTVDADGLLTARGRTLDIGVRVDYALSRSFYLFGGYRLSDHYLDGDESSIGTTNSANLGVRYRF